MDGWMNGWMDVCSLEDCEGGHKGTRAEPKKKGRVPSRASRDTFAG